MSELVVLLYGSPKDSSIIFSSNAPPKPVSQDPSHVLLETIFFSDSSIQQHPFFAYPAVPNPGIVEALETTVSPAYPDDGQELYLHLCEIMNTCPVGIIHRNLLNEEINLSFYGVSVSGVHAMAKALKYNTHVKRLNIKENFLNDDACYHIGEIFITNVTLKDLDLTSCHIGVSGLIRICGVYLTSLESLNLSRNLLGDEGGVKFATFLKNALIPRINLSKNYLGQRAADSLADVFKDKTDITHLDLSLNNFMHTPSIVRMLETLSLSTNLKELNLAWNYLKGVEVAEALSKVILVPTLTVLNLKHNRFLGKDIEILTNCLIKAKGLTTLDLSFNPLTTEDAEVVISKMLYPKVNIEYLGLEGICVSKKFIDILNKVKKLKLQANFKLVHGEVTKNWTITGPDPRGTLLKRAEYLGNNPEHHLAKLDVIAYFIKLNTELIKPEPIKDLLTRFEHHHVPLNDNFVAELSNAFPGPVEKKIKTVNFSAIADYIRRLWPEKAVQQDGALPLKSNDQRPVIIKRIKKRKNQDSTDSKSEKNMLT